MSNLAFFGTFFSMPSYFFYSRSEQFWNKIPFSLFSVLTHYYPDKTDESNSRDGQLQKIKSGELEVRVDDTKIVGGLGFALTHGSLLFECARMEDHATTALEQPDCTNPARIGKLNFIYFLVHLFWSIIFLTENLAF